jgi:site-specific DNA-adenine methylase
MKKGKNEVISAQVAESSKQAKSATPAKSTKKVKAEVEKKAEVISKNKEEIAEATKERVLLYVYPPIVAEGKTEGERQRRKKGFRQETRSKLKTMLKNYKKQKAEGNEKVVKEARAALKNFAKETLTIEGQSKFKLGFLFEKKAKVS